MPAQSAQVHALAVVAKILISGLPFPAYLLPASLSKSGSLDWLCTQIKLMTSWAVVCDVYFLEPQVGVSAELFPLATLLEASNPRSSAIAPRQAASPRVSLHDGVMTADYAQPRRALSMQHHQAGRCISSALHASLACKAHARDVAWPALAASGLCCFTRTPCIV